MMDQKKFRVFLSYTWSRGKRFGVREPYCANQFLQDCRLHAHFYCQDYDTHRAAMRYAQRVAHLVREARFLK